MAEALFKEKQNDKYCAERQVEYRCALEEGRRGGDRERESRAIAFDILEGAVTLQPGIGDITYIYGGGQTMGQDEMDRIPFDVS